MTTLVPNEMIANPAVSIISAPSVVGPLTAATMLIINNAVQQPQIATPTPPPPGSMRLYPKGDGHYYTLAADGTETELGTGGAGPSAATFVFNQLMPSASWVIDHNLGRWPSVTVIDSGNSVIIANVAYVTSDRVVVSFGSPTSGKAYLN
jgi:hypothetical protein